MLGSVVPEQTTAAQVSAALDANTPSEPLWNDLLAYDPPLADQRVQPGNQVAVDNELLRSCREDRPDRFLLLWAALNLADPRLDSIVREVLTDDSGHLVPEVVNAPKLGAILDGRYAADATQPHDTKATSNILSLLERCRLIKPVKHGGSIVGVEEQLPTAYAVPAAVRLLSERIGDRGFHALPEREVELALSIGANAWLNLSPEEFRRAYFQTWVAAQTQSQCSKVPDDLAELASQLGRRGQVVLQGPPGVGKTYIAKQYVRWATVGRVEDSRLQAIIDRLPEHQRSIGGIADEVTNLGLSALWDIVQFHPGYDYTDFVRALVAKPHGDGVTFVAQHRILSLISAVGRELEKRGQKVELVLILDEINRGDIPSIFGELLYALEYRGEAVATPYVVDGDASLTIPRALRVIGTMNTADRSIAVIDYALRRRFVFLDVASTDGAIRSSRFDSETTRAAALYLYRQTAEALSGTANGLQVGPSYFLASGGDDGGTLEVLAARYTYEVLPLLTEYELEGEVDMGVIAGLRQTFGLRDGVTQRELMKDLVNYLRQSPWAPAEDVDISDRPLQ